MLYSKLPGWAKSVLTSLRAKGLHCQKPDPVKRNFALKVSDINHLKACAQNNPRGDISVLCTAPIVSLLASSTGAFSGAKPGLPGFVIKMLAPACSMGILNLCCDVLLGLAVFDHTRYWQTCPECQEQVPEQRTASPGSGAWKEDLQTTVVFTLCNSGIWRNPYSWTLK